MKQKRNKKLAAFLFAILFIFGSILVVRGFIHAETSAEKEISNQQDKLDELKKKAEAYRQIIELKQKQQTTLVNQMEILDAQTKELETEIEVNQQEVETAQAEINRLSARAGEVEATISSQKQILIGLMQTYYDTYSQDNAIMFLAENKFSDVMASEDKLTQTSQKIQEILYQITSLKESLDRDLNDLQKKKDTQASLLYQLEQRNDYLSSTRDQKKNLALATKGEEMRYATLLTKVEEQQQAIQDEIEQLESAKVGQVDLGALPPSKKGFFSYPVNPIKITQKYGLTSFSKRAYKSGKHNGVDFGLDVGSAIYAAGSGKIIGEGNNGRYAYGKWIAIDHDNGLVTLYGHLSKQIVSEGDSVKQGDKIGLSGNTGFSTGPHVHFSVFAKTTFDLVESTVVKGLMLPTGSSLNPMNYL